MNFLILLLSISGIFRHDFHVSITNAELNESTNSLQISMKLFTEDLEDAIKDEHQIELKLEDEKEYPQADSLIFAYVTRHFWIKSGGEKLNMNFVGRELEQDIVFIYLEVADMPGVNTLSVSNTIFFDRFDDQSNIVNIEIGSDLESAFLEKSNPKKTLKFD